MKIVSGSVQIGKLSEAESIIHHHHRHERYFLTSITFPSCSTDGFFFLLRFMHRFFGRKNNNKVSGEYIASKWRRWRVYIVQALTARMKIKTKRNNMINKMERNFVSIDKAPSIEDICLECFRCHLRLYIFFSSVYSLLLLSLSQRHQFGNSIYLPIIA